MLTVINPSNGQKIADYQEHSNEQVEAIISSCYASFIEWRAYSLERRAQVILSLGRALRSEKDNLASQMTLEMGKPINQSYREIEKCAATCDYMAEHGVKYLQPEVVPTGRADSFVSFEPLGIIFGIMPWNFPLWQIFRFAIASFLAGNGVIVKHAPNVTGVALSLEKLIHKAGFPSALFKVLLVSIEQVEAVIADERIKAVTLTGSGAAGRAVAALAGRYLKKCVMELGGSDPFIVLKDAPLELAIKGAINGRLINSGQSCIAAKRFIVAKEIHQPFVERLMQEVGKVKVGDPMDDSVQVGPLARLDLLEKLERQVGDSLSLGAKALTGGFRLDRSGYYYAPTILTNIQRGMPAYDEELFGPVFAVFSAENEEEAIQLANDTPYGLGASLWTKDLIKAKRLAAEIESGNLFVNEIVVSDVRLPFGGIKQSGFGRELSHYGLKEFVNIKSVAMSVPSGD